jgi:hypothetical protein
MNNYNIFFHLLTDILITDKWILSHGYKWFEMYTYYLFPIVCWHV